MRSLFVAAEPLLTFEAAFALLSPLLIFAEATASFLTADPFLAFLAVAYFLEEASLLGFTAPLLAFAAPFPVSLFVTRVKPDLEPPIFLAAELLATEAP